ncbi:ABC transporter permease [Nonomuraea salmonea]|uniref:ABC transporter permease n=1 Tax=Nonomuraea salmonea TaxID=46181 RepID=UPI003CD07FCF
MTATTMTKPPRIPPRQRPSRTAVLNVTAVIAGLGIWTALSRLGVQSLPGPVEVIGRGAELVTDGTLTSDVLASLRRVFIGFALGTVLAIPIGFLMGWYATARALIEPYVQFFRTIPPLAIIPLAILLMGIGETPKVFVIFLAAFLSSVVSTFQGVLDVDKTLINAARVLGASDRTIFVKVVVPASTPFIIVGMRIGLGAAWGHPGGGRADRRPGGAGLPHAAGPALLRPSHDLRRPDQHRSARPGHGPAPPAGRAPAHRMAGAPMTPPRSRSGTSRRRSPSPAGTSSPSIAWTSTSPTASSSPSWARQAAARAR